MRVFVFLLVLVNLLFFVWTQGYLGTNISPDADRLRRQLLAEQVIVVARGEPPTVADPGLKSSPVEKKVALVCQLWSNLPIADADRFERLLSERFSAFKPVRTVTPGNATYWVFIPPLANKQEADKKAAELKKLGAPEFFIVQDAGPNRLAISLGIFSTEDAARERLEVLRTLGIKSARSGERNARPALAALAVSGPEAQSEALRETVSAQFPEARSTACKVPVALVQ